MTSSIAPTLYTESRLSVDPISPSSVLHIPTGGSSRFASRRTPEAGGAISNDEDSFTRQNLAAESSIFFRKHDKVPRSILWRVLNDRKVLSLQCVDLVQDKHATHESLLTFSLSFANPILQHGIAFADSASHDALEVFALTSNNQLYTISLRRDLLLRSTVPSSSDFDPAATFKSYTLSSFTFRHPFKLVAMSDLQLLVSLHDSSLLRLQRRAGESGASWHESYLHEGSWGQSLRGLISWKGQNTVKWGSLELLPSVATAIMLSPDDNHILTVSLDGTLKAWNVRSGKPGFQVDILGSDRNDSRVAQTHMLDPDQRSLLKVVDVEQRPDGDTYYCVVYSPKDHRFKFWAIRDADSQEYGYRDVQSDLMLIPPLDELMGTNVWQLTDFEVCPGPSWKDTQLWVRARSGGACRTFTVTFDLLGGSDDLEYAWKHQWAAVDAGSLDVVRLVDTNEARRLLGPVNADVDVSFLISRWLEFLLFPGRFDRDLLQAAFHIYSTGTRSTVTTEKTNASQSFEERLGAAVTEKVIATQDQQGLPNLQQYAADLASQWRTLFGLVKHLAQRQAEPLSLALDTQTRLCWSIRAGIVAPIRVCSEIEVYALNDDLLNEQDDEWILNSMPLADHLPDDLSLSAARLHSAARAFRASLSASFDRAFEKHASQFALRDAMIDPRSRSRRTGSPSLQTLYELCDFPAEVGDAEYESLTDAAENVGGLSGLDNVIFEALLDRISESPRGQARDLALARYGDKATIRGAQDALTEGRQTILDVLCLVTFMSQDLETDELSKNFRPTELYASIATQLREVDILLWLASHVRAEHIKPRRSSGGENLRQPKGSPEDPITTVLQSIFVGDWSSMTFPSEPLTDLLTYWCRAWTFGARLDIEYDGVTAHVMGNLLKHEDYRLAYEFAQFLPSNSWATYLRGRLLLPGGEASLAAACFRQAAEELSQHIGRKEQPIDAVDTSGLLSLDQREAFNAGLPRFFLHVTSLFEAEKLFSHAADFADLAIAELESEGDDALDSSMMDIDSRKSHVRDSSASMQVNLAMEEIQLLKISGLKEEILSRLFSNTVQVHRFEAAFSALVKMPNPAIKRASLTQLLTTILRNSPSELLTLKFPSDLQADVDSALQSLARKQLTVANLSIAKEPKYDRLLYSYRVNKGDFRGAAEVLYEKLQWLLAMSPDDYVADDETPDAEEEESDGSLGREILDTYLLLINALACCGAEEGWILAEAAPKKYAVNGPGPQTNGDTNTHGDHREGSRRVVTLEEVRKQYQAELDRRSEIAQGRFALVGGDGMDVDFS